MHQHAIALGDRLECAGTDRGVPRRDREGEEALAASGTESRSSVTSSPDGIRRWTGSAETVPASTTTLTVTMAPPDSCFAPATLAATSDTTLRADTPGVTPRPVRRPSQPIVADGVTMIDTVMAGEPELNAVYVLDGDEPTLVEAGPGADLPARARGARGDRASGPTTSPTSWSPTSTSTTRAGRARSPRRSRAPRCGCTSAARRIWPIPTRLVASTARTYGERPHARALRRDAARAARRGCGPSATATRSTSATAPSRVVHTPGHASHHIALHDDRSGAVFTGEAIGSHLPWATRLPPGPAAPRGRRRARPREHRPDPRAASHRPCSPRTSVPCPTPATACDAAAGRIRAWAETVRRALRADPRASTDDLATVLRVVAAEEFDAEPAGRSTSTATTRSDRSR